MTDQPDQPEDKKKIVHVGMIGHVGLGRHSRGAAIGAALSMIAARSGADEKVLLVEDRIDVRMAWADIEVMQAEAPKSCRPSPFRGEKTYDNPFSRRNRKRRR